MTGIERAALDDVPTYTIGERGRRWDLARSFMDREGLDALLVYGEHEDVGPAPFAYDAWFSNGRAGTTIIFPRQGEPLSLFPMEMFTKDHLESTRRGDPVWITPAQIRTSRDSGAIIDALRELGLMRSRIGVIGLEPYPPWYPEGIIPYRMWHGVLDNLPDATFTPVGMTFSRLIMELGPEEVAVVRRSASIGDAMVRAMAEAAAPGVCESEVYAAGMAAGFVRGTTPAAMHFWSGPAPLASGLPPWSYRPQRARILQDGDVISAEVFSNVGGRHSQHQATITIGEPHADLSRAAEVAREAYDAGLGALRPGRTFGDVRRRHPQAVPERRGWEFGPSIHTLNPMIAASGFPNEASRRMAGADAYPPEVDRPTMAADMETATDGRRARGDATRRTVARRAAQVATTHGLDTISVGSLAAATGVSKSGILTVFGNREAIQVAAVAEARRIYVDTVIAPVWGVEPGRERLLALLDSWVAYLRAGVFEGGCFVSATTVEFGHRDGTVAEAVRRLKREWVDLLEAELVIAGSVDPAADAFRIDAYLTAANSRRELFGEDAVLDRARVLAADVVKGLD